MEINSFQEGFLRVPQGKVAEVRRRIMSAINLTTPQAFRNRLNGLVTHSQVERDAIEYIFKEYRINKIWGNCYKER